MNNETILEAGPFESSRHKVKTEGYLTDRKKSTLLLKHMPNSGSPTGESFPS